MQRSVLITGGAGFIGSHVVRLFVEKYPDYQIICVDKLTYAGSLDNLREVSGRPNFTFIEADICDFPRMKSIFERYGVNGVIHLAAESHVDRSIADPFTFARTNVMGTLSLLQAALEAWPAGSKTEPAGDSRKEDGQAEHKPYLFYHISTDEVYGSLPLGSGTQFTEITPYAPHSPYSASKASSDHFVRAYGHTYGLPVIITNCSNNYGPRQYPEKLLPLFIRNIVEGKPLPVYGRGENVRDWLYVGDHARAIDLIFHKGQPGQTYNIGGNNEWTNIDLIRLLIRIVDRELGRPEGHSDHLITYVTDRPGHDLRYAIDSAKLRSELGWAPTMPFEEGLLLTVRSYLPSPGVG